MKPSASIAALKESSARDWLLRFAFGGTISVAAALITHFLGTSFGGLFLAFPAILPATLTLAKEHGGRERSIEDARGGTLGAVALIAFAVAVAAFLPLIPPAAALALGTLIWASAAGLLWWSVFG